MSRVRAAIRKPKTLRIAVAVVLTAVIAVLLAERVSMATLETAFDKLDWGIGLTAFLTYVAVTAVRALRFVVAGARLPYESMFHIAAVHAALLRVMPLRSGELAYGILLKRLGGGGFMDGMAALVMLRVLDLALFLPLAAALIAARFVALENRLALIVALAAGAVFMAAFFALSPLSRWAARRLGQDTATGLGKKLAELARTFGAAYELSPRKKIILAALTVAIWILVLAWYHFTLISIDAVDSAAEGASASVLGVLGSILPVSLIGTFGPMEGGIAVGLASVGESQEVAVTSALLVSFLMFVNNWLLGIPSWVALTLGGLKGGARGAGEVSPRKTALRRILGTALFSVVGGLILLLRLPYGFETNDQFQYLLLPYRHIYQGFLPGDWFTWETTHYHVSFSWLIRMIHALCGEGGFPYGVFGIHVLTLVGVAYGLLVLSRAVGWHWLSAALALFAVGFVRQMGIAGAMINHGLLLPADMALAPFLIACAAWVERRYVRAGLWLGLGGLIHANMAVLGPLVIAVPELLRMSRSRQWRPTLKMACGYLLLAWPTLLVTAKSFLISDPAPGAMEIMFKIRSPHHYDPDLLSSVDVWWPMTLLVTGLLAWLDRGESRAGGSLKQVVIVLVVSQVSAAFGLMAEWSTIVRLFIWRLSVPLLVIAALATGQTVVRGISSLRLHRLLFACAALFTVLAFTSEGTVRLSPEIDLRGFGLMIPMLIPLTLAALMTSFRDDRRFVRAVSMAASAVVLIWCALLSNPSLNDLVPLEVKAPIDWHKSAERLREFHGIDADRILGQTRQKRLNLWIRENTPEDANFLIPPGNNDFRLQARRGAFVDWKCCPMKGSEVLEWRRRMLAVMGTDDFPARGYALYGVANRLYRSRSLHALAQLARREGLTHLIAERRRGAEQAGLRRLATFGRWTVYQVRPGKPH